MVIITLWSPTLIFAFPLQCLSMSILKLFFLISIPSMFSRPPLSNNLQPPKYLRCSNTGVVIVSNCNGFTVIQCTFVWQGPWIGIPFLHLSEDGDFFTGAFCLTLWLFTLIISFLLQCQPLLHNAPLKHVEAFCYVIWMAPGDCSFCS